MGTRANIIELARKVKGSVILPESTDIRVLKAAQILTREGIAKVILPSENPEEVKAKAVEAGVNLEGMDIIHIDRAVLDEEKVSAFVAGRAKRGMEPEKALALLNTPLYFSMMYLKSGKCDACVCGAVYDTSDVLRASIQVVGTAEGIKLVSSYFLMIPSKTHPLVKEPILFADCGVNPDPDAQGLKDIAIATIGNFQKLFPGRQANAAFLSFSTKGSAVSEVLDKIIEGADLTKKYFEGNSNVNVGGELQFDAAIVPDIGKRKAPESKVAGHANIFIFPDLNAGNIAYKITERLGGFQAIGPLLQGLALPVSDLSRGCNEDDIVVASSIMLLQK